MEELRAVQVLMKSNIIPQEDRTKIGIAFLQFKQIIRETCSSGDNNNGSNNANNNGKITANQN